MRDQAHFLAAGSLAERKAIEARVRLRANRLTAPERDDLELLPVIFEAAAFDLLARGPRPTPANPTPARTRQQKRLSQAANPPIKSWQEEIDYINASTSDYIARQRRDVLLDALATVRERDRLITQMLRDDAKLEALNKSIGRVADISDEMENAA